jgi:DNA-binding protein H-NS
VGLSSSGFHFSAIAINIRAGSTPNNRQQKKMSVNLSKMTIPQLHELIAEAKTRIEEVKVEAREETRSKVMSLIGEAGFTVEEMFGGKRARGAGGKKFVSAIKYRNPKNPKQEWTGKGRPPQWLVDAVASGKTREDFAV